ncbi:uncharacterized protein LOC128228682 [Mya arenaria]|uniref:uncharacterized protein LOC128228682 n=1 Tax=Mya arenaria TaxID=6604 RepID=UPI0022E48EFF|nr:uncharacterized protein LOC128228682 [Mya arenaria]XP_052796090.1 uncharacterized protein LOC128228682 [Mya arenaria]
MSHLESTRKPRPEKKKEERSLGDPAASQEENQKFVEDLNKFIKGINEENTKETVKRFGEALFFAKTFNQDDITNTCEFNLAAAKIASDESVFDYLNSMKTNFNDDCELEFNLGIYNEKQRNFKEALECYERAEQKCRDTDKTMEINCLQRKLKILKRMKKYKEAKGIGENLKTLSVGKDFITKMQFELVDIECHMVGCNSQESKEVDVIYGMCKDLHPCGNDKSVLEFQAKVLNDVGMLVTQTKGSTEAIALFDRASAESTSCRTLLKAQIKQNAGAMKTILAYEHLNMSKEEFQNSLTSTKEARNLYSELRLRNSEGQCYMNAAFAQSRLYEILISEDNGKDAKKELEKTKLAYQHALEAAKATDDTKMKMQSQEGLAAVCYRMEDFQGCETYLTLALKNALAMVPKDPKDEKRLNEKRKHLDRTKK